MELGKERGRGQGGREGEYGTREGEMERTRREEGEYGTREGERERTKREERRIWN